MKKYNRQSLILDLIEQNEIRTQDELSQMLEERGVKATQATISRDIKELKIFKVQTETGEYKYTILDQMHDSLNERLIKVFNSAVLSIKANNHLIIVKTIAYCATVCGWHITNAKIEGIAGIITGHDTIMISVEEEYDYRIVVEKIKELMK